jgi:hypothetical protein
MKETKRLERTRRLFPYRFVELCNALKTGNVLFRMRCERIDTDGLGKKIFVESDGSLNAKLATAQRARESDTDSEG